MTTARQWWQRATAAVKDRRSLYLTRVAALRPRPAAAAAVLRSPELESAVIRATSHDERSVDYGSAAPAHVGAGAPRRADPVLGRGAQGADARARPAPAVRRRATRGAPRAARLGRVPFDLADFRDRSSPPSKSSGFSAFVRAYFRFLDTRSLFAAQELDDDAGGSGSGGGEAADDGEDARLDRVTKQQHLLDLLMQIRPYGDGMERGLILEAMDCVVIEIFEVYSQICTGIARFLVAVLGSAPTTPRPRPGETLAAARRRRGVQGMRVLRKAAEQSAQLSSYFELCRGLGVLNAAEFPAVERVPDDDIRDLEKIIMSHHVVEESGKEEEKETKALVVAVEETRPASKTVVTKEWVVFDDDDNAAAGAMAGHFGGYMNPFVAAPWDAVAGRRDLLL
ncbi:unnamed protein product [Miscanthus lutarioriparius]|uniref:AP180 N-terminal homology (ANTH) domain-containing protein n=1 Tax=Miscanthus lutarioriparius TaxID=422564 RepID=A0A811R5A2_9POAL|nr:unnamed protein product [Miscanthus lutarioriparius]